MGWVVLFNLGLDYFVCYFLCGYLISSTILGISYDYFNISRDYWVIWFLVYSHLGIFKYRLLSIFNFLIHTIDEKPGVHSLDSGIIWIFVNEHCTWYTCNSFATRVEWEQSIHTPRCQISTTPTVSHLSCIMIYVQGCVVIGNISHSFDISSWMDFHYYL